MKNFSGPPPPRHPCSIKRLFLPLFIIGSIFIACDTGSPDITLETVAAPAASPGAGEIESGTTVSLSTTTEGASIYYTLDGNEPSEGSTKYTDPIGLSAALTIRAFAVKQGMINSGVLTAAYTIKETKNTDPKSITLTDFTDTSYTTDGWQIMLVPSKTILS
ncbi:MAG: chitobiase/beta-hexosaminidase C-terminal domain-containing protein, partial [Treponema sp.]|nr:chitobiase/beta-hexosaminidase C-terminal domain-containing protein [Treponema sp.]